MVGLEREHGVGVVEQQAEPHRAVVEHLGRHDLLRLEAQRGRHLGQQRGARRAALERRRGEGQAFALAPDRHQARGALLHDAVRRLGLAAGLQPGMAASQRRMAGEGQLAAGREDAHAVVGRRLGGRQQEGGLGQVGPLREVLHLRVVEAGAVEHHRERIAEVGRRR